MKPFYWLVYTFFVLYRDYNRGLARRHLQDYEGTIEDYNQAIKIDPKYVKAY
ncbi:MAG: tetratricopeptide repeat protein [Richelia sp.]|nr:tetratricopeptide repeat protein [Richelia sp.]CDN17121.1 hypothetical protein RintRC_6831 [Richelia intracellularis]